QFLNVGRNSSRAVAGDAPFMTTCWPSKKSAEYSGYDGIARKPENGANGVLVHSHPLPTRSSTPHALLPAGWLPAGSGSQLEKSNTPRAAVGSSFPQGWVRALTSGAEDSSGAPYAAR